MKLFYLILFSCLASSCAQKIHIQQAYLKEDKSLDTEAFKNKVDIRTYYGGDAIDYITFQIDIDNRSEDTIRLSENDLELNVGRRASRRAVYNPIRKRTLIRELELADERLDKEKKAATTTNVIVSGLGLLTGVLAGGRGVETIIYSSDTAAGIMEERRQYNLAQLSIEEQIAYLEEYTLEEAIIAPGRSASFDVHFDRLMIDAYCELKVFCEDELYRFDYDLVVEEVKVRD